jgi:hypothetical protein
MDLISTTPELLPIVCTKLSEGDRRALRAVNRAVRVALNATVTHIRCCCKALASHQRLHEVKFPNLSSLAVDERYSVDDTMEVVQHLARGSARVLAKLQHLSLSVPMGLPQQTKSAPSGRWSTGAQLFTDECMDCRARHRVHWHCRSAAPRLLVAY